MRFDFSIYADNVEELGDALAAVRNAVPANVFDTQRRGFSVIATPHYRDGEGLSRCPDLDPLSARTVAPAGVDEANAPAKRHRRTREQIAADEKAAAEKAAAEKAAAEKASDAGAPAENDDPLGLGSDPEPEPPKLTPAEAKLKALEILREAFAMTGGPAAVKHVQSEFRVAKFIEVPDALGQDLLDIARNILANLKATA